MPLPVRPLEWLQVSMMVRTGTHKRWALGFIDDTDPDNPEFFGTVKLITYVLDHPMGEPDSEIRWLKHTYTVNLDQAGFYAEADLPGSLTGSWTGPEEEDAEPNEFHPQEREFESSLGTWNDLRDEAKTALQDATEAAAETEFVLSRGYKHTAWNAMGFRHGDPTGAVTHNRDAGLGWTQDDPPQLNRVPIDDLYFETVAVSTTPSVIDWTPDLDEMPAFPGVFPSIGVSIEQSLSNFRFRKIGASAPIKINALRGDGHGGTEDASASIVGRDEFSDWQNTEPPAFTFTDFGGSVAGLSEFSIIAPDHGQEFED